MPRKYEMRPTLPVQRLTDLQDRLTQLKDEIQNIIDKGEFEDSDHEWIREELEEMFDDVDRMPAPARIVEF